MTRLREEWICSIQQEIESYELDLKRKIGLDFMGIAASSAGISREQMLNCAQNHSVAVVPITTGEGIIGTFSDSVAAILRGAGFTSFVTEACDVAGIYEAYMKRASFLFMADDERYIGINLKNGAISDNNVGTARAYAKGLELMAGSLKGRRVLVLGCGIVGREIGRALLTLRAVPVYYDVNGEALKSVTKELGGVEVIQTPWDIRHFDLVMDATNQGEWIHSGMLNEHVKISAPGVPLSLDEEMRKRLADVTIHDWLQLGTLGMLGQLCR